jgi:hypothetical protein
MWIAGDKLYSAGNPQYGQTGDGSDHSYNAKDSSIAIVFEPQPQPRLVANLADKVWSVDKTLSHQVSMRLRSHPKASRLASSL